MNTPLYMDKDSTADTVVAPPSEGIAIRVPITPAKCWPSADARNQNPIIMPVNFGGDNFVIIDNPIGEMHNSPVVSSR